MIKLENKKKYFIGFLLSIVVALMTYFALKGDIVSEDEIVFSPSDSDELSQKELKTTLIAANNGDIKAIDKLVSHYGTYSDTPEGKKEHKFWYEKLKDAARDGNPEAKNHFPNGNPDE